jgi:hypothetical protein
MMTSFTLRIDRPWRRHSIVFAHSPAGRFGGVDETHVLQLPLAAMDLVSNLGNYDARPGRQDRLCSLEERTKEVADIVRSQTVGVSAVAIAPARGADQSVARVVDVWWVPHDDVEAREPGIAARGRSTGRLCRGAPRVECLGTSADRARHATSHHTPLPASRMRGLGTACGATTGAAARHHDWLVSRIVLVEPPKMHPRAVTPPGRSWRVDSSAADKPLLDGITLPLPQAGRLPTPTRRGC